MNLRTSFVATDTYVAVCGFANTGSKWIDEVPEDIRIRYRVEELDIFNNIKEGFTFPEEDLTVTSVEALRDTLTKRSQEIFEICAVRPPIYRFRITVRQIPNGLPSFGTLAVFDYTALIN